MLILLVLVLMLVIDSEVRHGKSVLWRFSGGNLAKGSGLMVFIKLGIRVAVCRPFLFLISHLFLKAERQRMLCGIRSTWRSMRRDGVTGGSGWRNITIWSASPARRPRSQSDMWRRAPARSGWAQVG